MQIVAPYLTGTTADILSRLLGPKLAERWKVSVVSDNRPGATGAIGAGSVAKAAPDGPFCSSWAVWMTVASFLLGISLVLIVTLVLPFLIRRRCREARSRED